MTEVKPRAGATAQGTRGFAERAIAGGVAPEHFRTLDGLVVSSIGAGTYLGNADTLTDEGYFAALVRAVELGTNFIDTAINYRYQRSERTIGAVLKKLFRDGIAKREELIIATKGGFLPFDGGRPKSPRDWIEKNIVERGLASLDEVALGIHCMTPRYLRDQIERSLQNLGVDRIDVYYLHNPETQLGACDRREFLNRLQAAMVELERAVSEGLIRVYGLATWDGFRLDPSEKEYLAVEDVVRAARAAVGDGGHHWGALQLPFNLAMHEGLSFINQMVAGKPTNTIDAANQRGIAVIASGSLLQGQLARRLPDGMEDVCPGLTSDAQRALQFARSAPGITAALCGMGRKPHVEENMVLARMPPVAASNIAALFGSG